MNRNPQKRGFRMKKCDNYDCQKMVEDNQKLCKECYYKEQGMRIELGMPSEQAHISELEEAHRRGLK